VKQRVLTLVVMLWFCAAPAQALTCQLLGCACNVSTSGLAFGSINPLSGAPTDATANVHVACSNVVDVAPSVTAKIGAGQSGTFADRQMSDGSHVLHYNLYSSNLYTTILGDGAGGYPAVTVSGGLISLFSWSADATIYGRAPSAPTAAQGAYTDTIIVRIDW